MSVQENKDKILCLIEVAPFPVYFKLLLREVTENGHDISDFFVKKVTEEMQNEIAVLNKYNASNTSP